MSLSPGASDQTQKMKQAQQPNDRTCERRLEMEIHTKYEGISGLGTLLIGDGKAFRRKRTNSGSSNLIDRALWLGLTGYKCGKMRLAGSAISGAHLFFNLEPFEREYVQPMRITCKGNANHPIRL